MSRVPWVENEGPQALGRGWDSSHQGGSNGL